MKLQHAEHIKKYATAVSHANTEEAKKQLFITLLARLFDSSEAKEVVTKFSLGAEKTILNVQRQGKASDRGRADTQYQQVIIEFEKDLKVTEAHAKEQLAEYLSGNWNSGETYNFTLISTDCRTWIVYAPDVSVAEKLKKAGRISAEDVSLQERDRITVSQENAEDFYYFLDTFLFKSEKHKATLESIQRDFGQTSDTFIVAYQYLYDYFQTVKDTGEVKVAYEQWKRFLSIAYSSFDASERIFIIHSYLSIFAKILAYEIITHDTHIDDSELNGIIKGTIFSSYNVTNFTDNDFFHWVGSDVAFPHLKKAFRAIASQIDSYDFNEVNEDILKGVYQELIDKDTRHSLGEYYTPDWLCEHIVDNLDIKKNSKLIDPSCGSGSFLRAAINKLKKNHPDLSANQLSSQVCGIDIHPLSVLIAKTTMLLALRDKIHEAKQPIILNIYLADTLLTPTGSVNLDLFGDEFKLWIDDKQYSINSSVFNNPETFDLAVTIAEDLADYTKSQNTMDQNAFAKALKNKIGNVAEHLINSFYNIYCGLKQAKEEERDSIWKFIVLNLYKPCFYYRYFDFVIGNPPWFTFNSIGNAQYQERLKQLAGAHDLVQNVNNMANIEIAAIFLTHCTNYFLNDEGKLAFVLPRSFLSADHHDNTRSGKALHARLIDIWDLDGVSPLFNVPSCVLFAERPKANINRSIPKSGRKGKIFKGRLRAENLNWESVKDRIVIDNTTFYYSKRGKSSALTNFNVKENNKINYYKNLFKKGADIIPRKFYFVEVTQEYKGDIVDRSLTVKSSNSFDKDAKEPWKSIPALDGRINTDYLYRTAVSRNVLPFCLHNPELILLPISQESGEIKIFNSKCLIERGEIETGKWFQLVENLWDKFKTEKNKKISAQDWINYHGKLTQQNFRTRYVVLYTSSSKNANACIIDRNALDLDFIIEHTTYGFNTASEDEACYLCTFFNSTRPNELIKAFQARGLFGARHVHKKILDVPFPKFDPVNDSHISLARLGKVCQEKAQKYLEAQSLPAVLGTRELGQLRIAINSNLKKELKEIDKLIKQIIEE